jgi:hypothetical protein
MQTHRSLALLALAGALTLAACGDSTGGNSRDEKAVALRFGTTSGISASLAPTGGPSAQTGTDQVVVTGSNGTLTITDVRLVVDEFELKGDDDVNGCSDDNGGDDCDDFDAGPLFVDLPLSNAPVSVSTGTVPPGTYREVEFEVEDLDDDEDNPAKAQRIDALLATIRQQFADWPRDASMLVTGTFTPTGGAPRSFRVFFEAEIEIEVGLNPPLTVTETSATSDVSVLLDIPALFKTGATVMDLSQSNGQLVEFEVKIRDGFSGRSGHGHGGDDD